MHRDAKIYVAGHTGLAGSALVRRLKAQGYTTVLTRRHGELELTDQRSVRAFFVEAQPAYVFLAAAKAGGIHANTAYPAEFITTNLAIENNVLQEAFRGGVKRLLFLGSACVYPRDCPQPMREEHLWTGSLEPTIRPYAVAKLAGIELCAAYNRQNNTTCCFTVLPPNLYGPGDKYDLENGHVLPSLIRRIHEAKTKGYDEVTLWGSGSPRREFLFSDDLADACCFLMNLPDADLSEVLRTKTYEPPIVNVAAGYDLTISDLAERIKDLLGYGGSLVYDATQPDGAYQKLLDHTRLRRVGWAPPTSLSEGIRRTYADFLTRHACARPMHG